MPSLSISLSGSAIVNGSKTYTVSDADLQSLLNWSAAWQWTSTSTSTPTNQQLLLNWVQNWITGTQTAVQKFQTPAAPIPPPISIS